MTTKSNASLMGRVDRPGRRGGASFHDERDDDTQPPEIGNAQQQRTQDLAEAGLRLDMGNRRDGQKDHRCGVDRDGQQAGDVDINQHQDHDQKDQQAQNQQGKNQPKQQQQPGQISEQDAQRILDALQQQEKNTQEKAREKLRVRAKLPIEKDW